MTENKKSFYLLLLSSALMPVSIIFFFHAQNLAYTYFDWVLGIAAALLIISVLGYLIAYFLFRSPLSAFVCVLAFWFVCFFSNTWTDWLSKTPYSSHSVIKLLIIIGVLALIAALLLKRVKSQLILSVFLSVIVMFVFLLNTVNVVIG
ncbi:MAG: hypothetical protein Q4B42_06100, partial [Oscillospiraceae bacterium]|nr:hypothetical protein [Oscillospiraceae bacterium]